MHDEPIDWKYVDQKVRELIALRGYHIAWEWHNGRCDDCEFVFDAQGQTKGTLDGYTPTNSEMLDAIEKQKLTVTHTKKTVKLEDKYSNKPVAGKGTRLMYAYLDWLFNIEKQKSEEKQCAAN